MGVSAPEVQKIGSRFRTVQSPVAAVPFDSGNTRSVELPRSFLYKYIAFRLSGTHVGGGTPPTGPIGEQPLGLIRRIDLIADGRKLLWSASGRDLFRLSHLMVGKQGEQLAPVAAGSTPFSAAFIVHNEAARLRVPIDSYFDPRPYEKVELRVQWGTVSDLWSTVNTSSISAASLDVQVMQSSEGAPHIMFNRLLLFDEQVVASTQSALTFNVPRTGLLQGFFIRVDNANVPADDSLNFVTLKSDNNFLHLDRLAAQTLKARNVMEYQIDNTLNQAGLPGYYWVDLTEDGLLSSALNTFDLNVLQLICDATVPSGTRTYRITYVYYEPITAA